MTTRAKADDPGLRQVSLWKDICDKFINNPDWKPDHGVVYQDLFTALDVGLTPDPAMEPVMSIRLLFVCVWLCVQDDVKKAWTKLQTKLTNVVDML